MTESGIHDKAQIDRLPGTKMIHHGIINIFWKGKSLKQKRLSTLPVLQHWSRLEVVISVQQRMPGTDGGTTQMQLTEKALRYNNDWQGCSTKCVRKPHRKDVTWHRSKNLLGRGGYWQGKSSDRERIIRRGRWFDDEIQFR
ncbi:hypothetical protein L1987_70735 [Smallanthus sonchifolius]|uniref:Uncharacterized protein n=1 Tax=Smallanthus sonchifolius TaxID=185202 RepID=A0ACB9ARC1_9ASTR|nr:hypothetical protein L1987_70735 [Smallanthus sonchifolius]